MPLQTELMLSTVFHTFGCLMEELLLVSMVSSNFPATTNTIVTWNIHKFCLLIV